MDSLPFSTGQFDVICSEGAIYNLGFEAGVMAWKRFLKPGGTLVVSEITWLTGSRPAPIQQHWQNEYPQIDVTSSKFRILEENGYSPAGYFVLPGHCWLDNYYQPLQNSFSAFLERNGDNPLAQSIVAAERKEIALYEQYRSYYSYGVYIAKNSTT